MLAPQPLSRQSQQFNTKLSKSACFCFAVGASSQHDLRQTKLLSISAPHASGPNVWKQCEGMATHSSLQFCPVDGATSDMNFSAVHEIGSLELCSHTLDHKCYRGAQKTTGAGLTFPNIELTQYSCFGECQCGRNDSQNLPFCSGPPQNTFIIVLRSFETIIL